MSARLALALGCLVLAGCHPAPVPTVGSAASGATTPLAALAALTGDFPGGGEEGRPSLTIRIEPKVAMGGPGGEVLAAEVVRAGLADDAIEAERIRVDLTNGPRGWRAGPARRDWRCARGPEAGRWTERPCP